MGRRPPQTDAPDTYSALADLDSSIIKLLNRRAKLAATARPDERKPAPPGKHKAWVEIEKNLRKHWDQAATGDGAQRKLWRELFSLVQQLPAPQIKISPDSETEREGDASTAPGQSDERGFLLTPASGPMAVDIPGPASLLQTRFWAGLLAQAQTPCSIEPVLINDALVDCIKALDHAGARLYWEGDALANRGAAELSLIDKVIFAGDDLFTLHLLIFLALPEAGALKLTGGSTLKNFDCGPLSNFLPSLGARLVSVTPHQRGVPLRLESSGVLPDEIPIPETLSPEAILGLLAAAPRYPQPILLRPQNENAAALLQRIARPVLAMLEQCGVTTRMEGDAILIQPGPIAPPTSPRLDLDPLLGAALLALPRFARQEKGAGPAGGHVLLRGAWSQEPTRREEWSDALVLLKDAGLDARFDAHGARCSVSTAPQTLRLDASRTPELFPLALALAAATVVHGRAEASVRAPSRELDKQTFSDFLANCGIASTQSEPDQDGEWLALRPCSPASDWDAPWRSPSPEWSLAYALAAYLKPGLKLDNPGSLSELMPRFWSLYNGLPKPEAAAVRTPQKPQRKDPDDGPQKSSRKRVKI
jgi:5-enolpyruvylshikimate-3-phosphate synthase